MDLNFIADPNAIPRPRDQVEIQSLTLTPYPDGQRIRVEIDITPFIPVDRPNIELTAHKDDGTEVASLSIVETMHHRIGLTVHLRQSGPADGVYTFQASLFYEAGNIQHTLESVIKIPDDMPANPLENRE